MNKLLTGKVTLVAGGTGAIGEGIVRALLLEDATVIVPAKSARDIISLKEFVSDMTSGRLVTMLTDYPDYEKVYEIAEGIVDEFGQIDLVIARFDPPAPSPCLTELEIADWQKMTDENITACFVCGRVALHVMKACKQGMYISISDTGDFEKKSWSVLTNLAASLQVEMARVFAEEVKKYNIRYHHLLVNQVATRCRSRFINKKGWITPEAVGNFIVQLYCGKAGDTNTLFQWLPAKKVMNWLNIKT
jgi:NADP-dependent 3-hydroxy acid dehydrogenase YdfG